MNAQTKRVSPRCFFCKGRFAVCGGCAYKDAGCERLTYRQRQVLDLIIKNIDAVGVPPTVSELARGLGVKSNNGINDHLVCLQRKGYLHRIPGTSRGLLPLDPDGSHRTKSERAGLEILSWKPGVPRSSGDYLYQGTVRCRAEQSRSVRVGVGFWDTERWEDPDLSQAENLSLEVEWWSLMPKGPLGK